MNSYRWPDVQAVLDVTQAFMASMGHKMTVVDRAAFVAGFDRARSVAEYAPEADLAGLAAIMFDGVATRHALLDGNKRAATIAALTFIAMNGAYLDVTETELERQLRLQVSGETSVDDLAEFFRQNLYHDALQELQSG